MYICNSLNKNGYSNFSLTILEYCEPEKCLIREKHYWDVLKPEYNIAQDPTAPMSGRKHSDKTKQILSDANKGENHTNFGQTLSDVTKTIMSEVKKGEKNPMYGKNHTEETKTIMSDAKKGENNPMFGKIGENNPNYGKTPSEETIKKRSNALKGRSIPSGAGRPSQQIEVTDIKNNNISTSYDSINAAARALNIRKSVIDMYFSNNQQKPYKGQYTFKKI